MIIATTDTTTVAGRTFSGGSSMASDLSSGSAVSVVSGSPLSLVSAVLSASSSCCAISFLVCSRREFLDGASVAVRGFPSQGHIEPANTQALTNGYVVRQ